MSLSIGKINLSNNMSFSNKVDIRVYDDKLFICKVEQDGSILEGAELVVDAIPATAIYGSSGDIVAQVISSEISIDVPMESFDEELDGQTFKDAIKEYLGIEDAIVTIIEITSGSVKIKYEVAFASDVDTTAIDTATTDLSNATNVTTKLQEKGGTFQNATVTVTQAPEKSEKAVSSSITSVNVLAGSSGTSGTDILCSQPPALQWHGWANMAGIGLRQNVFKYNGDIYAWTRGSLGNIGTTLYRVDSSAVDGSNLTEILSINEDTYYWSATNPNVSNTSGNSYPDHFGGAKPPTHNENNFPTGSAIDSDGTLWVLFFEYYGQQLYKIPNFATGGTTHERVVAYNSQNDASYSNKFNSTDIAGFLGDHLVVTSQKLCKITNSVFSDTWSGVGFLDKTGQNCVKIVEGQSHSLNGLELCIGSKIHGDHLYSFFWRRVRDHTTAEYQAETVHMQIPYYRRPAEDNTAFYGIPGHSGVHYLNDHKISCSVYKYPLSFLQTCFDTATHHTNQGPSDPYFFHQFPFVPGACEDYNLHPTDTANFAIPISAPHAGTNHPFDVDDTGLYVMHDFMLDWHSGHSNGWNADTQSIEGLGTTNMDFEYLDGNTYNAQYGTDNADQKAKFGPESGGASGGYKGPQGWKYYAPQAGYTASQYQGVTIPRDMGWERYQYRQFKITKVDLTNGAEEVVVTAPADTTYGIPYIYHSCHFFINNNKANFCSLGKTYFMDFRLVEWPLQSPSSLSIGRLGAYDSIVYQIDDGPEKAENDTFDPVSGPYSIKVTMKNIDGSIAQTFTKSFT